MPPFFGAKLTRAVYPVVVCSKNEDLLSLLVPVEHNLEITNNHDDDFFAAVLLLSSSLRNWSYVCAAATLFANSVEKRLIVFHYFGQPGKSLIASVLLFLQMKEFLSQNYIGKYFSLRVRSLQGSRNRSDFHAHLIPNMGTITAN